MFTYLTDFKHEIKLLGVVAGALAVLLFAGAFFYVQSTQAAAVSSTKSGDWSDATVWSTGSVPQAGDTVTIASGHTVTYDAQSDAVLGRIDIEGTLYFSRSTDTRLKTNDNIVVQSGGFLDMGTPGDYIPRDTNAELIWQLTQAEADAYVDVVGHQVADPSKGLYALGGSRWETHGEPLVRTWSKLAENASAGATSVVVENDVTDWYEGGTVVVTQTSIPVEYFWNERRNREGSRSLDPEHEVRTIQSLEQLSGGRTRITFSEPLEFFHEGTAPFQGEAALLTRNVVVKTELQDVAESTLINDVRERKFAHTMYMPNSKGDLQYTEFKFMGHYGNLGTYTIHTHTMLESSIGKTIRGISGWYNGFRCVNLHTSHGVLVEDNVCYNAQSTAFFQERDDDIGFDTDNVFAHNIAIDTQTKAFDDRGDTSIAGEFHRAASFWGGVRSNSEAFMGNVAAGTRADRATNMGGFRFADNLTVGGGTIPFTFVANESHSISHHGIDTWQNGVRSKDLVGSLFWRNGDAGIFWGAYNNSMKFFNARLLENARTGLDVASVGGFVQDSEVVGTTKDNSISDKGFFVSAYYAAQYPNPPVWVVRNTFRDLTDVGISQVIREETDDESCNIGDFGAFVTGDEDLRDFPVYPKECSAAYMVQMENVFQNVGQNLRFSFQANPNSWWKVFGYEYPVLNESGTNTNLEDFVVTRKDQTTLSEQGMLTKELVNAQSFYSPTVDGLITPLSSLSEIEFTDVPDERKRIGEADFTFWVDKDLPPTVDLEVTTNGTQATLSATAADDKAVTRIELLADWITLETCSNTTTCSITIDLQNIPGDNLIPQRKYAYLYARAFDGASQILDRIKGSDYEQRAYSDVVELGPEIVLAGQPLTDSTKPQEEGDVTVTDSATAKLAPTITKLSPTADTVSVEAGTQQTFSISASDSDSTLDQIVWIVDGVIEDTTSSLTTATAEDSFTFTFADEGISTVEVQAIDSTGSIASVEWEVDVAPAPEPEPEPEPSPSPTPPPPSPSLLPGDIDGNERVDIDDVTRLLSVFGKSSNDPDFDETADINGANGEPDGVIDIFDANTLMANWTGQ